LERDRQQRDEIDPDQTVGIRSGLPEIGARDGPLDPHDVHGDLIALDHRRAARVGAVVIERRRELDAPRVDDALGVHPGHRQQHRREPRTNYDPPAPAHEHRTSCPVAGPVQGASAEMGPIAWRAVND
jgi:hypothetical protein